MSLAILDIDFDFFVREHPQLGWTHSEGRVELFQEAVWVNNALGLVLAGLDGGALLSSPHDPGPTEFFQRLSDKGWMFASDVRVLISNSHAVVGTDLLNHITRRKFETLYHFDAHHDMGYSERAERKARIKGEVDCANWLYAIGLTGCVENIALIYPEWRRRTDGGIIPVSAGEACDDILRQRKIVLAQKGVALSWHYWGDVEAQTPPREEIGLITICQSAAWVPPWMDQRFEEFVASAPGDKGWLIDGMWPQGRYARRGWPQTWAAVEQQFAPIRNIHSISPDKPPNEPYGEQEG